MENNYEQSGHTYLNFLRDNKQETLRELSKATNKGKKELLRVRLTDITDNIKDIVKENNYEQSGRIYLNYLRNKKQETLKELSKTTCERTKALLRVRFADIISDIKYIEEENQEARYNKLKHHNGETR